MLRVSGTNHNFEVHWRIPGRCSQGASESGLSRSPLMKRQGKAIHYLFPGTSRQKDRDDLGRQADVHFINGLPQDFFSPIFSQKEAFRGRFLYKTSILRCF